MYYSRFLYNATAFYLDPAVVIPSSGVRGFLPHHSGRGSFCRPVPVGPLHILWYYLFLLLVGSTRACGLYLQFVPFLHYYAITFFVTFLHGLFILPLAFWSPTFVLVGLRLDTPMPVPMVPAVYPLTFPFTAFVLFTAVVYSRLLPRYPQRTTATPAFAVLPRLPHYPPWFDITCWVTILPALQYADIVRWIPGLRTPTLHVCWFLVGWTVPSYCYAGAYALLPSIYHSWVCPLPYLVTTGNVGHCYVLTWTFTGYCHAHSYGFALRFDGLLPAPHCTHTHCHRTRYHTCYAHTRSLPTHTRMPHTHHPRTAAVGYLPAYTPHLALHTTYRARTPHPPPFPTTLDS